MQTLLSPEIVLLIGVDAIVSSESLSKRFATLENLPVTILGMSQTGMASAEYLHSRGANCFLSEMLPASPANIIQREALKAMSIPFETGGHTAKCFEHAELVIVSPGIPPHASILKELQLSGKVLIGDVELAAWQQNAKLIGVTGTNGKTTTTMLVSAFLKASGLNAPDCGNIGYPVLTALSTNPDTLVVELSSAQISLTHELACDVAVLTNFRPDHLDWHGSLDAYKAAKFKLFLAPQSPRWAVLNADDPVCRSLAAELSVKNTGKSTVCFFSRDIATVANEPNFVALDGREVVFRQAGGDVQRLFSMELSPLPGRHNDENVLAAVAVAMLSGVVPETIASALSVFKGAHHRLEPVPGPAAVRVYNDSKATNVDAAVCALEAFAPQSVVLIAGGRDKMTDLSPLVDAIQAKVAHCILLGEAADRFETALQEADFQKITRVESLSAAVEMGLSLARDGQTLLFSPACASFDMFKDFQARGDAFKAEVARVLAESACLAGGA